MLTKRTNECFALEMRFDGQTFIGAKDYNRDFNIHHTELTCDTDEEWQVKIHKMGAELQIRINKLKIK